MNRSDIRRLQALREYPSLSILLPTHRRRPENQQDPIRVKNLVTEATDRLLGEFSKREIAPLLENLDQLCEAIDYEHALDGLALFVNQDFARKFYLPFPVKERVIVGDSFATRDLVFALNRSHRYWVLALSEQPTRLYEGALDTLMEVTAGGFPMTHEGPGGAEPLPGGFGISRSAYRDERHRQFFRQVDAAFGGLAKDDPLPLVVVGVDRYRAFFNEVSNNKSLILTTLTGSHDNTSAHELGKLVWPLVQEAMAKRRREVFQALDAAVSARKTASGMGEVWRMAQEGRGATLLVEEDFHYPARVDATGLHLEPADDPTAPDVIDDAVDDLIETVLAKGGRVVFVDNGTLENHQRVAMILRY
jgi:hypothetical protein